MCNLGTFALFAFTRFYLRVLADGNGIILWLKRNVILRKTIKGKQQDGSWRINVKRRFYDEDRGFLCDS